MLVLTMSKGKQDAMITRPDGTVLGKIMVIRVQGKQVRLGFDLDTSYDIRRVPSEQTSEDGEILPIPE